MPGTKEEKAIQVNPEAGVCEIPASFCIGDNAAGAVLCGLGVTWGSEDTQVEWTVETLTAAHVLANCGTAREAAAIAGVKEVEVLEWCRSREFVERITHEIENGGVANLTGQLAGLNLIHNELIAEFKRRQNSGELIQLDGKDLIREIRAIGREARSVKNAKAGINSGNGISHLTIQFVQTVQDKSPTELKKMIEQQNELLRLAEETAQNADDDVIDVECITVEETPADGAVDSTEGEA